MQEKEAAEVEIEKLKECAEKRAVAAENLRNELGSTRHQLEALDQQIAKDRDKLLKAREKNQMLHEKVKQSFFYIQLRGK